jgi:hypothetical protein
MAIQKSGRLQFQDVFEVVGVGLFTVDFALAATGLGTLAASGNLSVPQALLGDIVLVGNGIDLATTALFGYVASAGNVQVILLNNTAAGVDLASQNLTVVVLRLSKQYANV